MLCDKKLVNDVLLNKPGAFASLVKRYQKLVWNIVYRMLANAADTEEVSQETFLKVYQNLGQFRFECALSTWVGRIAFSTSHRFLKKRRIPLHDDLAIDCSSIEDSSDLVELEKSVIYSYTLNNMHQSLAELAPLLKTILSLYYLEEFPVKEISEIVDMPQNTVKSHLHRARKLMANKMAALGEPND